MGKTLLIILCILITSPVMCGLEFNGINDYVEVPDSISLDITSAITIEAWLNPDSGFDYTTTYSVFRKNSAYRFLWDGGAGAGWELVIWDAATGTYRKVVKTSRTSSWFYGWHHIAAVYDSDGGRIYINGIERATGASVGDIQVSGDSLTIFSSKGTIEDARIYNRVLSLAEIKTIYHSRGSDNIVNGLVGRWLMNEGTDGSFAPNSPISQWKMNDNAATKVVIDSVGSNVGTAQQNTDQLDTTGKINGALTFNGSSDYIHVGDIGISEGANFTIAVWFNTNSLITHQGIYTEGNTGTYTQDFIFKVNNDGTIVAHLQDDVGSVVEIVSSNLDADTWYHGIFIKSGNNYYLYLNGDLVDSDTVSLGTRTFNTSRIGALERPSLGDYFKGVIDEVRIYDFALTTTQISALYNSGHGTEEERNPKVLDISGNGNHGTPVNSPIYRATPMKLIRRPR